MSNIAIKELESIIKNELMKDIYLEKYKQEDDSDVMNKGGKGKKLQVPKQLGGVTNLGKTFFVNEDEIKKKKEWAWNQMQQKYGDDICGQSASQSTISTTKAETPEKGLTGGTETGTMGGALNAQTGAGLIHCDVVKFMKIPNKFFESSDDGFKKLVDSFKEFDKTVAEKSKDEKWKETHQKSLDEINMWRKNLREAVGPKGAGNIDSWTRINKILSNEPWKSDMRSDSKLKGSFDNITKAWNDYSSEKPTDGDSSSDKDGGSSSKDGGSSGVGGKSGEAIGKNTKWEPRQAFKIDIHTNFNDQWFQRKFKSGLLNAAIMAIKTDAMSRAADSDPWKGHKYTANEMLPQDKRKLDGIQWKMTNNVAKDYITFLLGWTRDKKYKMDEKNGPMVVESEMSYDPKVGAGFAKKALGNRGFLNRISQKLFSGGQANNVISVAFQLADPNDGWEVVEGDNKEGDEGAEDVGGSPGGGATSGAPGGSSGGTSGGQGKGDGNTPVPKEVVKGMVDPKGAGGDGKLSLLQRVVRLEKDIFGGEQKGDEQGGAEGGVSKDGAAPSPDSPDAPQAVGKMEEEPNPEPEAANGEPTPEPLPPLDDGAKPVEQYKIFHEPKKQKQNDEGEIAYQRKQLKSDEPVKTKAGGDLKVGQFRPYDWATPSDLEELKKTYNQFLKEHPEYIPGADKKGKNKNAKKEDAPASDKGNDVPQGDKEAKVDGNKDDAKKDTPQNDTKKPGKSGGNKTPSKKGGGRKKKAAQPTQEQPQQEEEPQKMAAESTFFDPDDGWVEIEESSFTIDLDDATTLKLINESVGIESDRYRLVKDVCNDKIGLDKLIDNCILGYGYK